MRILYINHEKNLGGAAKSLIGVMQEMVKMGHNILVLTPYKKGKFVETCKENGIEYIYAKFFLPVYNKPYRLKLMKNAFILIITFLSYIYNAVISLFLSIKLKKYKIDLIHTNSSVINIGCFLKRFLEAKHVIHFREFVEEDFLWEFLPSRNILMNLYSKNSDAQIFISNVVKDKYDAYFKASSMYRIYNGVTIENCGGILCNKKGFLSVGRIMPGKGQDELIEALNIVVNQYDRKDICVTIIGSGEKEYLKVIKRKITEFGLEEHVELLGYRSDVNEIRKKYNYEIVCSNKEAFGRVVIEAMLSKNIILAPAAGAFTELICDGEDGFLYKAHDVNSLAGLILRCLKNEMNVDSIRECAFRKANDKFTQKINAQKINELYTELGKK